LKSRIPLPGAALVPASFNDYDGALAWFHTETANAVRQAIATLPEELRTPLALSEYDELSHAEIAQILNCSPKAVETRLYRARKQLRSVLSRLLS